VVLCVLAGIKGLHIFGRCGSEISRISCVSAVDFQLCNPPNQELIAFSVSDKLLLNISLSCCVLREILCNHCFISINEAS
jgi:hypothetical protein